MRPGRTCTKAPCAQAPDFLKRGTFRPRRPISQKKLAEPEGPAKFEQGGFTSRRRKDPKTLFPGASPENSFKGRLALELTAMQ
jgi:hypothetical protein